MAAHVRAGDLESEPERETSSTALVHAPSSDPTEPPVTPLSAQVRDFLCTIILCFSLTQ